MQSINLTEDKVKKNHKTKQKVQGRKVHLYSNISVIRGNVNKMLSALGKIKKKIPDFLEKIEYNHMLFKRDAYKI